MNSSTLAYQDECEDLLAPENFSMVEKGVYRSAFPRSKNIPFLRSLRLRAVVALIPEDYPVHMTDFYEQYGVKLISHGLDGNKWPFKEIDEIGKFLPTKYDRTANFAEVLTSSTSLTPASPILILASHVVYPSF